MWMIKEKNRAGYIHVIPINDLREHEQLESCWCQPVMDHMDENVFIHQSMDRGEEYENGRKLS
jgi:hypothetical protein